MAFVIFADQLCAFVLWVSVLEAAAQSAPTAPPSDRSDREAHSSHHHTPCILRQVLRPHASGAQTRQCLPRYYGGDYRQFFAFFLPRSFNLKTRTERIRSALAR